MNIPVDGTPSTTDCCITKGKVLAAIAQWGKQQCWCSKAKVRCPLAQIFWQMGWHWKSKIKGQRKTLTNLGARAPVIFYFPRVPAWKTIADLRSFCILKNWRVHSHQFAAVFNWVKERGAGQKVNLSYCRGCNSAPYRKWCGSSYQPKVNKAVGLHMIRNNV